MSWPLWVALLPYIQNINPTLVGSLSLLELLWLCINGPGALFSYFNFMESRADLKVVCDQKPPNPDDIRSAKYARRNERTLFIKQTMYFLAGILSAFTPPPISPQNLTTGSIIVTVVFIGGSLLNTYTSFKNRQDRRAAKAGVVKKEKRNRSRDVDRDTARDSERDLKRDTGRDISRDIDRDVDRDRNRDIGRDIDRDKAHTEGKA